MFKYYETTTLWVTKPMRTINFASVKLDIVENKNFDILYGYSFDGKNFSNFDNIENIQNVVDYKMPIYLAIKFQKINKRIDTPSIYGIQHQNTEQSYLIVNSISIDGNDVAETDVKTFQEKSIVSVFPRMNIYDNHENAIRNWINQNSAINEMYGTTVIYFYTSADSDYTIHTLMNNSMRNVVDIKRMKVMAPNGELPQDRVSFTEWDFALQDEFILHIVKDAFTQAFGCGAKPNSKDYLYIPIINKLFKISTVQQGRQGFMGKVAWWEVYLANFEEDDSVQIDKDLFKNNTFGDIFKGIEDLGIEIIETGDMDTSNIIGEIDQTVAGSILNSDVIAEDTIDEKKLLTKNFSNVLTDLTWGVSLKETEAIREAYDNRLSIISVNDTEFDFPLTMYNCSEVAKRSVAMQYSLDMFVTKNKHSTTVNNEYSITLNFAYSHMYIGELLDIIDNTGQIIMTIFVNRTKLQIKDIINQKDYDIDFRLEKNKLYQLHYHFNKEKQYHCFKILEEKRFEKTILFENVYKIIDSLSVLGNNYNLNKLRLYGGTCYAGPLTLTIDENEIFVDDVKPLINRIN